MLEEVVDQLGNPHSISYNEEILCPECGDLFKLSGYRVEKMEIAASKLAHSSRGRDETPNVESTKEMRMEVDLIPDQELPKNEAPQPQHSINTKFIPSERTYKDINSLPN